MQTAAAKGVERDKTQRRQCKMWSSKKITCKGTLRQVFICLRPRTPHPLHTVNVYTVYLLTQGRGGGVVENQREREGQHRRVQITSWVENTNMSEWTQEINSDKHLPQSPFTLHRSIFLDDGISHCVLKENVREKKYLDFGLFYEGNGALL